MMRRLLSTIALAAGLAAPALAADARHPLVVEIFQSQGCSSCPPANANVNSIADRPDVLALSFAVTYWDQLGWKDSFATKQFTDRQWDYARGHGRDQVWTPQVWLNGRTDLVGTRKPEFDKAVAAAAAERPAGPEVSVSAGEAAIAAGSAPKGGAQVWLVRYDPRIVQVAVKAGENNGKTLPHRNIVHELVPLGKWTGAAAKFAIPAGKQPGLATAVLVQAGPGGAILSAGRAA
jgi:hypothetical protein